MTLLGPDTATPLRPPFFKTFSKSSVMPAIAPSIESKQPPPSGELIHGFDVDDAARNYIKEQGFGEYFVHRTGHSIGEEPHGNGANMDNLETHDERRIVARTCFSVEPGIYLPEFGIRSEVNVYVDASEARVTGEVQRELVIIE